MSAQYDSDDSERTLLAAMANRLDRIADDGTKSSAALVGAALNLSRIADILEGKAERKESEAEKALAQLEHMMQACGFFIGGCEHNDGTYVEHNGGHWWVNYYGQTYKFATLAEAIVKYAELTDH